MSRRRERGATATRANGAAAATAVTTGGFRRSRRRRSGAARPAASAVQAAARMAVERRTDDGEYTSGGGRGRCGRPYLRVDGGAGRLSGERRDHARARVGLRMPLDAQGPAAVRQLDGLDQLV